MYSYGVIYTTKILAKFSFFKSLVSSGLRYISHIANLFAVFLKSIILWCSPVKLDWLLEFFWRTHFYTFQSAGVLC